MGWIRALAAGCAALTAMAAGNASALEIQKVAPDVYALVGELGQRSPSNLGNNATFGVVVTAEGVVLVDPGGSRRGAEAIAKAVRTVTDRPVRYVVNTGGQDHRWLGNGYFKERGATILASEAAVADQTARFPAQAEALRRLIGEDGFAGTEAVHADRRFADRESLTIGGVRFEIRHSGGAHTPGDSFVWLPDKGVVFTGDIVYVERILGVGEESHAGRWIKAFEAVAALKPAHVVPGHGHPATLERARADTYDYLVFLRQAVRGLMDAGKDIQAVGGVDQGRFARLLNFDQLKGRNIQQVFAEMEFD